MCTRAFTKITLLLTGVFLICAGNVNAQRLIINNGSTFTINGGTLDINCDDILIKDGGSLLLQTGTIIDKNGLNVEPGGTFTNTDGSVLECSAPNGYIYYIIKNPNGNLTIIPLPKKM